MNEQKFLSVCTSTKNMLVRFAKERNYRYHVKTLNKNSYDVVIYCSSEALENL